MRYVVQVLRITHSTGNAFHGLSQKRGIFLYFVSLDCYSGPPPSLSDSLATWPVPCRVEFIKDIQWIPPYGQRLCWGEPSGDNSCCLCTVGTATRQSSALTLIPGPPHFSQTIQLGNPFPRPVTFVTGQRLLKQSLRNSASRLCTMGSATRPSSRPLRHELATGRGVINNEQIIH